MPIIFTIFANPKGDLENLSLEQNGIQDALYPLVASNIVEHLIRTDTDRTAFFNMVCNRAKNEFVILHYGGHAEHNGLHLNDSYASFEEMASEIANRNPQSLQLVFLNGCSTLARVRHLHNLGIPAVIATSAPISDNRAKDLAIYFYQRIAKGESIIQAYETAVNFVNSYEHQRKIKATPRDIRGIELENQEGQEFPWGLYLKEGMALEGVQLFERKAFNNNEVEDKPSIHQMHYGLGDNVGRDKIVNIFSGKGVEYEELLNKIKDLKADIEDIPDSRKERKEKKINELKRAESELVNFKENLKKFYQDLRNEDQVSFNEIFGNHAINEIDQFFKALNNLKNIETDLSSEQKKQRRNHFDNWDRYMKGLPEDDLFEQQRRDSLYYLKLFELTVSLLKEKLQMLGYYTNTIDDNFDKETVNAIMRFQEDNDMRHIDGMFGELTFKLLGLKLEEINSKSS